MICSNRKGASLIFSMLLSMIMTSLFIVWAFYLNSIKPNPIVPIMTLLSADYQMESAVILQMQKYKNNPANEPKSFEKNIMPGVKMTVNCSKNGNNEWLFDAKVEGRGIYRTLTVIGNTQIPDKLLFVK